MADIRHSKIISVPAIKVYEALTTGEGIREWWTDNADLDQNVGGKGTFRFHYGKPVETIVRIADLQEAMLVQWIVEQSFRPEQVGTMIIFELHKDEEGTKLDFKQTGYIESNETFELMNKGWAYYLVSLKRYLETGKGAPSPNLDLDIWNNLP